MENNPPRTKISSCLPLIQEMSDPETAYALIQGQLLSSDGLYVYAPVAAVIAAGPTEVISDSSETMPSDASVGTLAVVPAA